MDLGTATVASLRASLEAGTLTSRALVEACLAQISRYDSMFRAIRCLAPAALDEADASDEIRRKSGPRSPIEGIPVLIKDNIDIAGLPTTAGALALEHNQPLTDAPLITALRAAGAVILGKTNLSELANFLTEGMPSGYSSLGGQVLNPYDTSITPSGSSSGSGTAAALGYAPLTVGTETDGSITSPADYQSLVGMKPTIGLVSQAGIFPIAYSQDTAGPMTRTVADAAALLAALSPGLGDVILDSAALQGVRVGVVRGEADPDDKPSPAYLACFSSAVEALAGAGATTVDVTLPKADQDDELAVLHYEFGLGVERYFATLGPDAQFQSLAEIQGWNVAHADVALKFRQMHIDAAVAIDHEAGRAEYEATRERDLRTVTDALSAALGDELECLVFPGASGCGWAARAGWPSIVIPAGYTADNRRPVGIMLVSRPGTDARLLSLAYALEQAHPVRRTPFEINPAVFR